MTNHLTISHNFWFLILDTAVSLYLLVGLALLILYLSELYYLECLPASEERKQRLKPGHLLFLGIGPHLTHSLIYVLLKNNNPSYFFIVELPCYLPLLLCSTINLNLYIRCLCFLYQC